MARFKILNGPSKWGLMLALSDCRIIEFTLSNTSNGVFPIRITINSVSCANDCGNEWFFEGTETVHGEHARVTPVKGRFSTFDRNGWLEFEKLITQPTEATDLRTVQWHWHGFTAGDAIVHRGQNAHVFPMPPGVIPAGQVPFCYDDEQCLATAPPSEIRKRFQPRS